MKPFFKWLLAFAIVCLFGRLLSAQSVPTISYNNYRTGANLNETILTPANVASLFHLKGSFNVDGYMYAQPLLIKAVTLLDSSVHDLLLAATMNNTVYAFDAVLPNTAPLWSTNLGATFGNPPNNQLLYANTGVGIVSTPVVDVATNMMYVVHATSVSSWVLVKINIVTGAIVSQTTITGEVVGTGDSGDSTNGANLVFNSRYALQRPGLTLANGRVYIAFGSWADPRPEHGWVFAYDANDLSQKAIKCLSPNNWGAAIWQSGGGLAVDDSGNLFVITGNGAAYDGSANWSQTIIKFDADLNIVDWYTPANVVQMNDDDLDFSGRPMLVPGENLLVGGAKDHNLYGVNPTNMGHLGGPAQIIPQGGAGATGSWGVFAGAIFNGRVYSGDNWVLANTLAAAVINPTPIKTYNSYRQPLTISGSCNGTTNCILWATTVAASAGAGPVVATLRAFDGNTLAEIYSSDTAPGNLDTLGVLAKFVIPVVADGRVYVATQSNKIQMYGLPQPQQCPCTIWSSNTVPGTVDLGPGDPVELGVKFKSDVNGSITGLRFYKSPANTGTHVGNLWTSSGTLLASVVFSNETASGWQQANFITPISVTADTIYVASYHTNVSHFSIDLNGFGAAGVDRPPLHALATNQSGNGVYAYNANSLFPVDTYMASNYWVDVVFSNQTILPTNPFVLPNTPATVTSTLGLNKCLFWAQNPSAGMVTIGCIAGADIVFKSTQLIGLSKATGSWSFSNGTIGWALFSQMLPAVNFEITNSPVVAGTF